MAAKATTSALNEEKTTDVGKTAGPGRKKRKTSGRKTGEHSRRMETMGSRGSSVKKTKQKKASPAKKDRLATGNQLKTDGISPQKGIPMGNEATLVVSAGLMILMMLSNFGLCGWVGEILSSLFFGVFGFSQYVMPIVFFVIVLMLVANDYSVLSIKKSGSLFGLMLVISAYSQLFCAPEGYRTDEIFGDGGSNHFLGGVIAGSVAEFLRGGFGMAGAFIILTCLLILLLVMLTQKSAIAFFRNCYNKIGAFVSDYRRKAAIAREARKARGPRKEPVEEDAQEYGLLDMEEDEWTFPDEPIEDDPQPLHTSKVEDKVRAIEDEIDQTRKKGKTRRKPTPSKVQVPLFVESDEVHPKDSLKELHAEAVPFTENDGKTDPFDGDLDYSAFHRDDKVYPELSDQVMKALHGQGVRESGQVRRKSGTGLGSSIEEIRIHHGDEEGPESDIDMTYDLPGDSFDAEEEFPYEKIIDAEEGTSSDLARKDVSEDVTADMTADSTDLWENDFEDDLFIEEDFPSDEILPSSRTSQAEDAFHIVEEGPETGEMDPRKAMQMSRTPVTSKEKKMGRPMPISDEESSDFARTSAGERKKGRTDQTRTSTASTRSTEKKTSPAGNQVEPVINRAKDPKPVGDRKVVKKADYTFPPMALLTRDETKKESDLDDDLKETALKLQQTLQSFGVNVKITDISCGPSVTRYELFPEQGVKVSKIVSLTDDIKLNLAAADIRIEAPIPGKAAIGIEVPNKKVQMVHFRDLIDNRTFRNMKSRLSFAAGKDIGGKIVMADLAKMPHMLVAGTTGSGKSVFINTIIMSILYKAAPDEVRFIMVDPKMVELSVYNGIPHLLIPVVTDPKKASSALSWAVAEMTERYRKFAETGTRNLSGYNKKVEMVEKSGEVKEGKLEKLPQIVIIIDELADLMMVAKSEVEDAIVRLSQLARAAGIHMVIATQRPSVDVITGLIKANVPSRVALSVSSGTDSRTILDMNGAEKLLGNGDMLFYPSGYQKPVRVQGAFISDEDIIKVTDYLKANADAADYDPSITEKIEKKMSGGLESQDRDEYFEAAARFIMEKDKATIGMLQRMFKIGFNRAARIIDQLADAGIVGPEEGTKPRKILMSPEQLDAFFEEGY